MLFPSEAAALFDPCQTDTWRGIVRRALQSVLASETTTVLPPACSPAFALCLAADQNFKVPARQYDLGILTFSIPLADACDDLGRWLDEQRTAFWQQRTHTNPVDYLVHCVSQRPPHNHSMPASSSNDAAVVWALSADYEHPEWVFAFVYARLSISSTTTLLPLRILVRPKPLSSQTSSVMSWLWAHDTLLTLPADGTDTPLQNHLLQPATAINGSLSPVDVTMRIVASATIEPHVLLSRSSWGKDTVVCIPTSQRFETVDDRAFQCSALNVLSHFDTVACFPVRRLLVSFDTGTSPLYAVYAALGAHRAARGSKVRVSVLASHGAKDAR